MSCETIAIAWRDTVDYSTRIELDEARALLRRHGYDVTAVGAEQLAERLCHIDLAEFLTAVAPDAYGETERAVAWIRPE